eukprot:NODE_6340_length_897_cov_26.742894_g5748_i0.p1 GENE.NODE_6340_length_897_cov_26.742894_g5748_i0~~NODE_6340_length_897_cov_26.742894_g5748_i0.p1  ORF type:complete len:250 (+),score=43.90 NODE_6340_length_897_cov_26.742894_g5748_i0:58-807(+)
MCCPDTRVPALTSPSDYEPKGTVTEIEGIKTYVSGSPSEKAIIVVADILGFESGRHKGIADQFAGQGYHVVLPDFFGGDKCTFEDFGKPRMMEFLAFHKPESFAPRFDVIYKYLSSQGSKKIGMIGFCWGCWAIFNESARGSPFHGGVNCHPSLRIEEIQQRSVDALAEKVTNPQLLFPCADDPENVGEGGSVISILKGKTFGELCSVHRFTENNHGFVSQGDVSNPAVSRDVEIVMKQASEFFAKILS